MKALAWAPLLLGMGVTACGAPTPELRFERTFPVGGTASHCLGVIERSPEKAGVGGSIPSLP